MLFERGQLQIAFKLCQSIGPGEACKGVELKNRQPVLHIMLPQQLQCNRVSCSQALNPVRPDNNQSTHTYIYAYTSTHIHGKESWPQQACSTSNCAFISLAGNTLALAH